LDFYSDSSLKQHAACRHVAPLRNRESEPTCKLNGRSLRGEAVNTNFLVIGDLTLEATIDCRDVRDQNKSSLYVGGKVVLFNATFNSISVISWQLVLLVEEAEVPIEKKSPSSIE